MNQEFVVDLLSPTAPPPKPPRRKHLKVIKSIENEVSQSGSGSPAPEVSNSTLGRLRQAPPPTDDENVFVSIRSDPVETFDLEETTPPLMSTAQLTSSESDKSSLYSCNTNTSSMRRAVLPPSDDSIVIPCDTNPLRCDELLLASVPYHTISIEPSPALTLDNRRSARRSRLYDRPGSGRLKSAGSFENEIDNISNMLQASESTRSSSTPLLNTLTDSGLYHLSLLRFTIIKCELILELLFLFCCIILFLYVYCMFMLQSIRRHLHSKSCSFFLLHIFCSLLAMIELILLVLLFL